MLMQILFLVLLNVKLIQCTTTDVPTQFSASSNLPTSTLSEQTSVASASRGIDSSSYASTMETNAPTGASSSIQSDTSTMAMGSTASVTVPGQSDTSTMAAGITGSVTAGQTGLSTIAIDSTATAAASGQSDTSTVAANSAPSGAPTTQSGTGQTAASEGPTTQSGTGQTAASEGPTTQSATGQTAASGGPTTQSGTGQTAASGGPTTPSGTGQTAASGGPTTPSPTGQTAASGGSTTPAGTGQTVTNPLTTTQPTYTRNRTLIYKFTVRATVILRLGIISDQAVYNSLSSFIRSIFSSLQFLRTTVIRIEVRQQGRANDYDLYTTALFEVANDACDATCINNHATNQATQGRSVVMLSDGGSTASATIESSPVAVSEVQTDNYAKGDSPPGRPAQIGMGLGISFFVILVIVEVVILTRKFGCRRKARHEQYQINSF